MSVSQYIPNIFTIFNLILGFVAIINIQNGNYIIACYIILLAAVFDSLDGKIARLFKISSNFGKEIDSLADLVSFCLTPSLLVYDLYCKQLLILGEVIASIPLILGAIRLARFNLEDNNSDYFLGLPTPMCALGIVSIVLLTEQIKLNNPGFIEPKFIFLIVILISLLMVTDIKYPKFPILNIFLGKKNNLRLLGILIFLLSFIISIFSSSIYKVIIFFVFYYLLSGVVFHFLKFINYREKK